MKTYIRDNSSNSLSNIRIISLYHDSDSLLFIGTEGGGLNVFNLYKESFENTAILKVESELSSQIVYAIRKGINEKIWVGTDTGLWVLQKQGTSFSYQEYIPNIPMVTDIKEVDQDILWVTSNTGVYEINKHTRQARLLLIIIGRVCRTCHLMQLLLAEQMDSFCIHVEGVEKDT